MDEEKRIDKWTFDDMEVLDIKSKTAGIISHDVNNFLVAIGGNISLAKACMDEDCQAFSKLEQAEKACEMLNKYANRLGSFARAQKPDFKESVLSRILKNTNSIFMQDVKTKNECIIDENLYTAEIDPTLIKEVIENLLKNANAAINDGGTIKISAANFDVGNDSDLPIKKGSYVKITIEDSGSGIPPEKLDSIFKRKFIPKQGTGILLSYYIVKKHNGYFTLQSEPAKGTKCTIYLPVKQKAN